MRRRKRPRAMGAATTRAGRSARTTTGTTKGAQCAWLRPRVEAALTRTRPLEMKVLIAGAFIAAAGCAILSHAGLLSATSIVAPVCLAPALILVLLHLVNAGDRRY